MKVYFSCSITGGRSDQKVYQSIVRHLEEQGWEVPTAHLAGAGVLDEEGVADPIEVYQRDVNWVKESDIMVVEVSTPSHGVGYEIAIAEFNQKPIFCCYEAGKKISKMILGNGYPYLQIYAYHSPVDLFSALDAFLQDFQQ
jgi:hypothetical protein